MNDYNTLESIQYQTKNICGLLTSDYLIIAVYKQMKKERYVTNSGAELDETHRPLRGQK
jgi:hypothetical protein